jgi:hypothetical protein
MKIIKKIILWFLAIFGIFGLIKLGTWLMKQKDDYQFCLGLFIISGMLIASVVFLYTTIYNIIEKSNTNELIRQSDERIKIAKEHGKELDKLLKD